MSTVAIIPVRATDLGGRGIMPEVGGRPLLAYTIDAAKAAPNIDRVLTTTDSPEIQDLAVTLGSEAPFLRPGSLTRSDVPIEAVLQHAIDWLEAEGDAIDVVAPLEMSHPIRPPGVVEQVVQMVQDDSFDSVFAALEIRAALWSFNDYGELRPLPGVSGDTRTTRQPVYRELAGLASAVRVSVLRSGAHLGGRVGIVPIRDVGALVDTQDDAGLELARRLLERVTAR